MRRVSRRYAVLGTALAGAALLAATVVPWSQAGQDYFAALGSGADVVTKLVGGGTGSAGYTTSTGASNRSGGGGGDGFAMGQNAAVVPGSGQAFFGCIEINLPWLNDYGCTDQYQAGSQNDLTLTAGVVKMTVPSEICPGETVSATLVLKGEGSPIVPGLNPPLSYDLNEPRVELELGTGNNRYASVTTGTYESTCFGYTGTVESTEYGLMHSGIGAGASVCGDINPPDTDCQID